MNIALYMDQGVVANLTRHSLYSQQFSTCAPIVLFTFVGEDDDKALAKWL